MWIEMASKMRVAFQGEPGASATRRLAASWREITTAFPSAHVRCRVRVDCRGAAAALLVPVENSAWPARSCRVYEPGFGKTPEPFYGETILPIEPLIVHLIAAQSDSLDDIPRTVSLSPHGRWRSGNAFFFFFSAHRNNQRVRRRYRWQRARALVSRGW